MFNMDLICGTDHREFEIEELHWIQIGRARRSSLLSAEAVKLPQCVARIGQPKIVVPYREFRYRDFHCWEVRIR